MQMWRVLARAGPLLTEPPGCARDGSWEAALLGRLVRVLGPGELERGAAHVAEVPPLDWEAPPDELADPGVAGAERGRSPGRPALAVRYSP